MGHSLILYICAFVVISVMMSKDRTTVLGQVDTINLKPDQLDDGAEINMPRDLFSRRKFNTRLCRHIKSKEKPNLQVKLMDLSKGQSGQGQSFRPGFQVSTTALQNATLRFKCNASYPVVLFIMGFEGILNARLNNGMSDDEDRNVTSLAFHKQMDLDLPHKDYFKIQIKCASVVCRNLDHSSSVEITHTGSSLKVFPEGFSGGPEELGEESEAGPSILVIILAAIGPGIILVLCIMLAMCCGACRREMNERRIVREQQAEMMTAIMLLSKRHPEHLRELTQISSCPTDDDNLFPDHCDLNI